MTFHEVMKRQTRDAGTAFRPVPTEFKLQLFRAVRNTVMHLSLNLTNSGIYAVQLVVAYRWLVL